MKIRRILTTLSLLLICTLTLGACKKEEVVVSTTDEKATEATTEPTDDKADKDPATTAVSTDGPKELIIGTYMPITTMVPWSTTSDGDGYVIRQIYHTLVEMDKESKFRPSLATSWECAEDGVTWTVKIRDDIYWQTGNDLFGDEKIQVTAEDVKYSYDFNLDPENGSVRHTTLSESIESVEVIDDFTIQFVTKSIDILFEYKMYQVYIIPQKAVESKWDFAAHPVGSGAYKFVEHVIDTHIILEKNEDFWQEPALDKITYKVITDKTVSSIALQNEEIDIALAILPTDVGAIVSKDYLKLDNSGIGSLRWVSVNCKNPLFEDVEVRRALAMAIDTDSAVSAVFKNDAGIDLAVRAYAPISLERPGGKYVEDWKEAFPTYNPEEALKILESKGWAKNSNGILEKDGKPFKFTLQVGNNDANREKLAVIVSSQLKAIGIDATAQTVEWGTHSDDVKNGNVEMYIMGGYSNLDGPFKLMRSDEKTMSPNCGYLNAEVDTILDEAWKTLDYDKRCELLGKAATIYAYEAAHLSSYYEYVQIGYNQKVTDFDYATVYQPLCSTQRNVSVK